MRGARQPSSHPQGASKDCGYPAPSNLPPVPNTRPVPQQNHADVFSQRIASGSSPGAFSYIACKRRGVSRVKNTVKILDILVVEQYRDCDSVPIVAKDTGVIA